MSAEVFVVGGGLYESPARTTFEQDAYLSGVIHDAKIDDAILAGGDVIGAVFRSGKVAELLAGLLVPVDTAWSPTVAAATRAAVAACTDPAEKQALRDALDSLFAGFFVAAGKSSPPSPPSSIPPHAVPNDDTLSTSPTDGRRRPRRRRATPPGVSGPTS